MCSWQNPLSFSRFSFFTARGSNPGPCLSWVSALPLSYFPSPWFFLFTQSKTRWLSLLWNLFLPLTSGMVTFCFPLVAAFSPVTSALSLLSRITFSSPSAFPQAVFHCHWVTLAFLKVAFTSGSSPGLVLPLSCDSEGTMENPSASQFFWKLPSSCSSALSKSVSWARSLVLSHVPSAILPAPTVLLFSISGTAFFFCLCT